eukprot:768039-Hanusia_phi.AAC.1
MQPAKPTGARSAMNTTCCDQSRGRRGTRQHLLSDGDPGKFGGKSLELTRACEKNEEGAGAEEEEEEEEEVVVVVVEEQEQEDAEGGGGGGPIRMGCALELLPERTELLQSGRNEGGGHATLPCEV